MDGSNAIDRKDRTFVEAGSSTVTETTRPIERQTQPAPHHPGGPKPATPDKTQGKGKRVAVLAVLALAAIGGGGKYGYQWYTHDRFFVTTDDAYVTSDITQIAAKISGHISALAVAENSRVRAGNVIARVDDGDYKLAVRAAQDKIASQRATIERIGQQIDAARTAVRQSEAQLESARATVIKANADYARQAELSAQRFASVSAFDAARAARDTAAAAVRSAEAAIAKANADVQVIIAQKAEAEAALGEQQTTLAKAERDLSFTEIRASVDGTIGTRAVEIGSYVQPGSRITALIASGDSHIDANFKETQIGGIRPGATVEVTVDAYDGRVFQGHVASLSPGTGAVFSLLPPENATGNFTKVVQRLPVRILVDDPEGKLRTGLSVVVSVDSRSGAQ